MDVHQDASQGLMEILAYAKSDNSKMCAVTVSIRAPFDYTKWQENLFEDVTVEELSKKAMENRLNKRKAPSN